MNSELFSLNPKSSRVNLTWNLGAKLVRVFYGESITFEHIQIANIPLSYGHLRFDRGRKNIYFTLKTGKKLVPQTTASFSFEQKTGSDETG